MLIFLLYSSACLAIVGGRPVENGEFDSVVALVRLGKPFCTGVALSPKFVLTAAHCLQNKNANSIRVYEGLGQHFTSDQEKYLEGQHLVSKAVLHPSLNFKFPNGPLSGLGRASTSDMAILILETPLKAKKYFKILTRPSDIIERIKVGEITTAVGYGYTGELDFMPWADNGNIGFGQKRKADIPIFKTFFNQIDMRNTTTDTCYVDSGGPVFINVNGELRIAAIVSASYGFCAEGKYATLYSLAYHSACWIKKITGISDAYTGFHCGRNIHIAQECFTLPSEDLIYSCANMFSDALLNKFEE